MAQERALAESGRGADTPSTWVTEPMSTEVPSVDESNATTAAQPTNKTVQTERATPVAVDGATAIFVPAYTRTDDGAALEQTRDELTHLVGVYSEPDVRKQLGEEYDSYEITRAIERGERMTREHPDNATAAIRVAEKNEERGVDRGEGVATDGGAAARRTLDDIRNRLGERAEGVSEDDLWCLIEDWEAEDDGFDAHAALDAMENKGQLLTDGGEPAGTGCECVLRGCGNEIAAERDDGYCSDRCKDANAEIQLAAEQNRRVERRRSGEADVPRAVEGGDKEGEGR